MNTLPVETYKTSQKLHPLSLIAQLNSRQTNGCLQVMSNTTTWSLYLEQGKILYFANTVDPFGRLDRQLRRLSGRISSLVSAVRVQVRLLFESAPDNRLPHGRDYEAICWLVEQQHITPEQAAVLIEELAKEVLESFLTVQMGSYELTEQDLLSGFPKFCQLNPRPLVEHCHTHLRHRPVGQPAIASDPARSVSQSDTQFTLQAAPSPVSVPSSESFSVAESLPVAVATSVSSSAQPVYHSTSSRTSADTSSKPTYSIACIDDSPTVLQAINSFLDDKIFSVVLISDPIKALMQVARSKPDLVLLDVTMPNLDGYELCSMLRKHPNFRHTPIVMVTSHTGFIDRAKAKLVGASGYLTKPFTQPDLIKVIFKHLM
jgi:two-component system, chemotaxis family, response regulator PixG